MSRARIRGLLLPLALVLVLGGCERAMHDMYQQPKDKPLAPSALFANGNSARRPPAGSVPASGGALADTSSGRHGRMAVASSVAPPPVTAALLARGRQRFDIYCAPCHGRSGDGDGMIVRRGFPAPPSYHTARLRHAPDRHFYQVITHGYGVMYPYADRVAPRDRWAIVAWIRALQLSQYAPVDRLAPQDLKQLALLQPASTASAEHRP
ncbi:MAG TPA: cytochrome c [Rhodanobacteraceae bacterium]|nr:cytochrome c [Rhodanobacteraceae bacterium]